ncbi:MAG: Trm112 family protein [Pseudomonadota bacterium]|nr:Trm112 family protein [Pseudomonadota bacterium]
MALDSRFLSILCCPVSKRPLLALGKARTEFVNQAISRGDVQFVTGAAVTQAIQEGLISDDSKVIYRVDDGIPVLLPDSGIGTTQLHDFPQ